LDSLFETPRPPADLIELVEALEIGAGGHAAVCAARERRDDPLRTGRLVSGARWTTEEDAPTARRVSRPRGIEGTRQRKRIEVRVADRVERVVRASNEGLQAQRIGRSRPLEKGDRDRVRARLERNPKVRPRLHIVARF